MHKEQTYKTMAYSDHHVTHFDFDGYLVFKSDEKRAEEGEAGVGTSTGADAADAAAGAGAAGGEEGADGMTSAAAAADLMREESRGGAAKPPARNQFNYSERATQTVNNPPRSRATNTEPPPHRTFSGAVNQFSIYDAYVEDTLAKERAKEKAKNTGGKGHKDDANPTMLNLSDSHSGASMSTSTATADDLYHSPEFTKRLATLERMANQNTYDEITQDFKYWDDAADELRESKEGTLLPLWEFTYLREKKKHVTALAWNPACRDLFAVAYGSLSFAKQGPGVLCCFSLKNPSFPEFVFQLPTGVLCIDIHPRRPHLIAAGLYDGSTCVFDLSTAAGMQSGAGGAGAGGSASWASSSGASGGGGGSGGSGGASDGSGGGGGKSGGAGSGGGSGANGSNSANSAAGMLMGGSGGPRYRSHVKAQHADPVWQVAWQPDDLDGNPTFYSVSSDGTVKQAALVKNELMMSTVIKLALNNVPRQGLCFDFNRANDHLFVVGTEEGDLIKCSKDYNSQYLQTFESHSMAVYRILYNPFYTPIFLTCSGDWTVKLWDHTMRRPILLFDFGCPVADVAWAPYSATVFAVATQEGRVVVYDLEVNKYDPICSQQVVGSKTRLTKLTFSPFDPVLLVGDDKGCVKSLKLSPNLRKKGRGGAGISADEQRERLEKIVMLSLGKPAGGR
ncbi:WD40-repeat-containing domain protein [Catenaria anguillulae PL171]|uniref:WD40-repeat-containing domain protein n=1 Tax=Catenaria anguillulae PL171 TaxID=765915 RepID=A0A1Y2HC01_9FUNG|nr:WD40-repeat-containing domain protein [Catenaria anguillulae PL171]